jgi:glycerol transport system permease protein
VKTVNQRAWLLILPVVICVAFSAILPLMTVVNYSVQDIISPERRVFVGTEWFKSVMRDDDLQGALLRQIAFSFAVLVVEIPLGIALALAMPAKGWHASAVLVLVAISLLIPVERRRHDLADLRPRRHRPVRRRARQARHRLQLHRQRPRRLAHRAADGRLALDAAGRPALLRRPARDPRRLLPGGEHRRRVEARRLPLHPAAQAARRADDRRAAALHGQLHDLHRAVRPHRRRPGNATTFLSQYLTQKAVGQFDLGPAAAFSLIYFLIILLLCFILYNWMQRVGTADKEAGHG